jgi:HK97 gp10 family phage protein
MASELKGFKELSKKLSELGPAVGGKQLRASTRVAAKSVQKAAIAFAPTNDRDYLRKTYKGRRVAPGFLKRNINLRVRMSRDKTKAVASIGPSREAFYGTQFVEIGTSKMPAKPWLQPALKATKAISVNKIGAELKKRIEKVAKR